MHDEYTVAFEIKRPWPHTSRWPGNDGKEVVFRHWPALVTVWHVGEEHVRRDWWPEPDAAAEALLREMADFESKFPHWFTTDGGDQAAKLYALWGTFAWRLNYGAPWYTRLWRRKTLSTRWLAKAMWLVGNEHDNLHDPFKVPASALAVRAPVSTKFEWNRGDPPTGSGRPAVDAEYAYTRLRHMWVVYHRESRLVKRAWRFHIRHLEVQVHPLQHLRRWLLTRCAKCGGTFRGTRRTVISNSWHRTRVPWYRGEVDCFHEQCIGSYGCERAPVDEATKP